jgi:hypothetical protein
MSAVPQPSLFDRLLLAISQIIRGELSELSFLGTYEYSVDVVNGDGTIDGKPTDPTVSLPPISHAKLRPGLLGETVTAAQGAVCRVVFINGQPSRPEVVGFLGQTNATSEIDAGTLSLCGGGPPLARVGDSVVVYFPPLMQVAGTVSGAPFVGVATITSPAIGSIQAGSGKANSG